MTMTTSLEMTLQEPQKAKLSYQQVRRRFITLWEGTYVGQAERQANPTKGRNHLEEDPEEIKPLLILVH